MPVRRTTPQLSPTRIIGQTWRRYRHDWPPLLALAGLVFVPAGLAVILLRGIGLPALIASAPITFAAMALGHGALVWAVDRAIEDAGPPPVAEALRQAGRRWPILIVATVVAAVSICLGLVILIIPGLVLLSWWMLLLPVLMLERPTLPRAFRRARALVLGRGWPVLGVAGLTLVIQLAFSLALAVALVPVGSSTVDSLGAAAGNCVAAPFVAIAWTLTYRALRADRP